MEDDGTLSIGTRLGEFEIRGLVGIGGFGIVYRAFDHDLEREVAIKEYMPGLLASRTVDGQVQARGRTHAETFEAGRRSFMLEAKMLARFDHPALVKVFRFWEGNGTAYMVMPLYTGQTLAQVLKQLPGPPTEAWLMGVLVPLLGALEALHSQQIFHRDVSPDNILLLRNGRPVLLDFGAARQVISDRTQTLTAILKPNYAPIEQYAEVPSLRQGPWTDLYALGAVVYASLTGKPPPPAAARTMQDELVPLTDVAAKLETEHGLHYSAAFLDTWQQALAVRPTERPQSVRDLMQRLGLMPTSDWVEDDSTVIAPVTTPLAPHTPFTRAPGQMPDGDHTVVVTGMKFDPVAPTGHDMRMVSPGASRRHPTVAPPSPPPSPASPPPSATAPPAPPVPPAVPRAPLEPVEPLPRKAGRGGLVTAMLVSAVVLGIGGYVVMTRSAGGGSGTDTAASVPPPSASAVVPPDLPASPTATRPAPPMITEYPEAPASASASPKASGAITSPTASATALAVSAAASKPDRAALAAARASAAAAARADAASKAAAMPKAPEAPSPAPILDRPAASATHNPAPASEARSPAPTGPRSPDEACGKKVFIARDMCVQEACAHAEFSRHPVCADLRRRAEEERRREMYGG